MIRRFLTRVLIVILIAACAYNWQQTQKLQGQVAALQAQAAQPRQVTVIETPAPEPHGSLSALPAQWQHYKQQVLHRAGLLRSTSKKVFSYVKF